MKHVSPVAVLAALVLTLTACASRSEDTMAQSTPSPAELQRFAATRVFFGHQSVGRNILHGVELAYAGADRAAPPVVETTEPPAAADQGVVAHALVGTNGDPESKIAAFRKILDGGMADAVDVALLKFCYLDVHAGTDVEALFADYRDMMTAIGAAHPDLRLVYTTVPLTTEPSLKSRVKGLLTRTTPPDVADNVARERYNALVRATYGPTGQLFDVAAVESTTGSQRAAAQHDGTTYYTLAEALAADPGHLNERGATAAAQELIRVVTD